jgi:AraC-like DNA-binding protein
MGRAGAKQAVALELLPHLRRAHDHIDRHYGRAIDLDELAGVAGVSKFHFARSFEAAYGLTPIRYLTLRRVERAQDLLRRTRPATSTSRTSTSRPAPTSPWARASGG